ncbi:hypothetical protein JCM8097_002283 [Rhodosporidiobolus ruineniae]
MSDSPGPLAPSSTPDALPPLPERRGWRAKYAHPLVQIALVALICFACPGMFNALSGVGGGGQLDPKAANDGNVALYSTFAVVGFFSGSIINKVGARAAFAVGASGYALYMGSLLSLNINGNNDFVIAAGAILGACAGVLWTAQGSLTLAYATESTKGRAFALFWGVFNMGAVVGASIELGLTYNSENGSVGNGVYATFLAIGAAACFIPLLLVDPAKMVRQDGSRVIVPVHPTWKQEFVGMYNLLRKDYWVFLLLPFFVASNAQLTWQQNSFNGALFTLRTRSLNSLLFWLAQIFGAGIFGVLIDLKRFRRPVRAWGGLVFLLMLNFAIYGAGYHYQKGYYRTPNGASIPRIDLNDSNYASHGALYFFMGVTDAVMQNYIYWLMGAMYNQSGDLARIVGIYKGVQSAGAAGFWRMDSVSTPYMTELAATWAICIAALVFAAPVVAFRIKDTTEVVESEKAHDSASHLSAEEKKAEEV